MNRLFSIIGIVVSISLLTSIGWADEDPLDPCPVIVQVKILRPVMDITGVHVIGYAFREQLDVDLYPDDAVKRGELIMVEAKATNAANMDISIITETNISLKALYFSPKPNVCTNAKIAMYVVTETYVGAVLPRASFRVTTKCEPCNNSESVITESDTISSSRIQ